MESVSKMDLTETEKEFLRKRELDENAIVIFRKKECKLSDAIKECKPGESIANLPIEQYDALLEKFEKDRGMKFQRSVDRRYGNWRFILFNC